MRSCDEMLELISAALDGELTEAERQELDEHLSSCPACGALFSELKGLDRAVGEPVEAPEGFARQVMDRIAGESGGGEEKVVPITAGRALRVRWKGWAAAAAAVAVVILGVSVLPNGVFGRNAGTSDSLSIQATAGSGEAVPGNNAQAPAGASGGSEAQAVADNGAPATADSAPRETAPGESNGDGGAATEAPEAPAPEADPGNMPAGGYDMIQSPSTPVSGLGTAPADSAKGSLELYCGVLVLTGEPLPQGLEEYASGEDEAGNLTYEVPSDYFFAEAAALEEAENVACYQAGENEDMEYGLIIVERAP